jgi:hypothetical protein
LEVAALLLNKAIERGDRSGDLFEDILLEPAISKSLMLTYSKAVRRQGRYLALWMSSNLCDEGSNIMHMLPIDLLSFVCKYM